MPIHSMWTLEYRMSAYSTAGDANAYHEIRRYKRGASGAPTALSNAAPVADHEDLAGGAVTVATASDGGITISVTGVAATTIDWLAIVDVIEAP
jgi:hypothetical protein